jgi:hypothetical protein
MSKEAHMLELTDWITALAIGVLLLAPLFYGLATLSGMREKRLYPLLRQRRRDGRCSSVMAKERHYTAAHLGESYPPIKLDRHLFSSIR